MSQVTSQKSQVRSQRANSSLIVIVVGYQPKTSFTLNDTSLTIAILSKIGNGASETSSVIVGVYISHMMMLISYETLIMKCVHFS